MPLLAERASTQVVPSVKVEGDDLLQEVEVKDPVQPVAQVETDLQLVMTRDPVGSTENWRGSPQNGRCQAAPKWSPSSPQVVEDGGPSKVCRELERIRDLLRRDAKRQQQVTPPEAGTALASSSIMTIIMHKQGPTGRVFSMSGRVSKKNVG